MRSRNLALLSTIVVAGIAAHYFLIQALPARQTLGDEASHTLGAHELLDSRGSNLLPGRMLSHHRSSLGFSYFSLFADPELIRHPGAETWIIDSPHEHWSPEMARFLRRASLGNLGLLVLASLLAYALARECGFRPSASALAPFLLLFHPRIGFYVQALWPEILHLTLVLGAFLAFSRAVSPAREVRLVRMLSMLALSGVLLAYARLTRGVVEPMTFAMALMAGWVALRAPGRKMGARRLASAALAAAVLLAAYEGTLWPQRATNLASSGSSQIGHNLWRNIEGGLGRTQNYPDEYFAAASEPVERERLARERVIQRALDWPLEDTLGRQLRVFFHRLDVSYLDRAFKDDRWRTGGKGRFLTGVTALLSWTLLGLGLVGMVLRGWQTRAGVLLSVFTLYYIAALLVVIPNPRMFVQLVPPLAIFSAGALDSLLRFAEARRSPR